MRKNYRSPRHPKSTNKINTKAELGLFQLLLSRALTYINSISIDQTVIIVSLFYW